MVTDQGVWVCPILVNEPGGKMGEALADTLDSLGSQLYGGWGLSVVSHAPCPDENFEKFDMLEWLQVEGDLMSAVNSVVGESGADWVALVEAGSTFEPHFLYSCVDHLQQHSEWRLLYVDEDRIGQDGERYDPLFKPEFNLELLRSMPYLGNCLIVKRKELAQKLNTILKVDRVNLLKKYVSNNANSTIGALLPAFCTIEDALTQEDYQEIYETLEDEIKLTDYGKNIAERAGQKAESP